jgi:hypothetical protein
LYVPGVMITLWFLNGPFLFLFCIYCSAKRAVLYHFFISLPGLYVVVLKRTIFGF